VPETELTDQGRGQFAERWRFELVQQVAKELVADQLGSVGASLASVEAALSAFTDGIDGKLPFWLAHWAAPVEEISASDFLSMVLLMLTGASGPVLDMATALLANHCRFSLKFLLQPSSVGRPRPLVPPRLLKVLLRATMVPLLLPLHLQVCLPRFRAVGKPSL
jgi:hypothetical protein